MTSTSPGDSTAADKRTSAPPSHCYPQPSLGLGPPNITKVGPDILGIVPVDPLLAHVGAAPLEDGPDKQFLAELEEGIGGSPAEGAVGTGEILDLLEAGDAVAFPGEDNGLAEVGVEVGGEEVREGVGEGLGVFEGGGATLTALFGS